MSTPSSPSPTVPTRWSECNWETPAYRRDDGIYAATWGGDAWYLVDPRFKNFIRGFYRYDPIEAMHYADEHYPTKADWHKLADHPWFWGKFSPPGPPEGYRRHRTHGFLYFIGAGPDEPIKIGFTTRDPEERLVEVQVGNHRTLHVMGSLWCDEFLEGAVHEFFSREHIRGEWFRLSDDLKTFIMEVLQMKGARMSTWGIQKVLGKEAVREMGHTPFRV